MGGANAGSSGSNDTQVSGYEAEINKQKAKEKAQKEAFGKYDKSNTNPNDNIQKQKKKTVTTTNNGGEGAGAENVLKGNLVPGGVGGPTKAEVSQSEAANADADTEANRLLKIKKKGRSQSIISGSQGVTKMAADYSLGKKSLLGRV